MPNFSPNLALNDQIWLFFCWKVDILKNLVLCLTHWNIMRVCMGILAGSLFKIAIKYKIIAYLVSLFCFFHGVFLAYLAISAWFQWVLVFFGQCSHPLHELALEDSWHGCAEEAEGLYQKDAQVTQPKHNIYIWNELQLDPHWSGPLLSIGKWQLNGGWLLDRGLS